ncbi:MAG: acyl carrier protein [Gammaproteobacteria bacterium]|nr:acyl carrier protein [Gammaproteobacteria bacterium]
MDSIETELIMVIEARLRVNTTVSSKISELNLDSIKTADFLSELEDEFDVRFDQDVFEVETIADLAAYIRERLRETSQ